MADHLVGGLHCAEVEDLAASFVLGALEAPEAERVRAHLAGCPESHPEFAELGSVVPALFESVEVVQPSTTLRERILSAAAAEKQRERMPAVADTQRDVMRAPDTAHERMPARELEPESSLKGFIAGLFRRPIWAGVAMAALVLSVALGGWAWSLQRELLDYRNAVAAVLDAAAKPGAQLAVLGAGDGSVTPNGLAAVGADGRVTLVAKDLTPTTGGQVYEAWLIAGTGNPVPIGGFTVGDAGTASFATTHASVGAVVTVALTLEAGPGATTPTLPIVMSGTAQATDS